jgi:hypothetical protein
MSWEERWIFRAVIMDSEALRRNLENSCFILSYGTSKPTACLNGKFVPLFNGGD